MKKRTLSSVLGLLLVLTVATAGTAAASRPTASGWSHFHWVPTDAGEGFQCGTPFTSMHPTGYVDFWSGPIDEQGRQQAIQHWDGSMTFTGPAGTTVTLREDDWRYIDRTYTSGTTFSETTRFVGLLEALSASDGARKLQDAGTLTTKTENQDLGGGWYVITSLETVRSAGVLPIRRSGYDFEVQGWNRECAFFADHLR